MEKRRLVVKKREITIKEGEFEGWSFNAVMNPPLRTIEDLTASGIDRMVKGLASILRPPWNFVDENGEPMADPSEDTIRDLPTDLIAAISTAYIAETTALPQK
jgi:hypothetical protein